MQCEHGKAYILISSIFKDLSLKKNKKGEMVREIFPEPCTIINKSRIQDGHCKR